MSALSNHKVGAGHVETASTNPVDESGKIYPGLSAWLRQVWLQGVALYATCFGVLAAILFATPGFLGTDDYYHARIASQIIEQRQLRLDFPWLPKTILNQEHFTDHHLLFHLYVAPWFSLDGIRGAKLATASIAAGVFAAAWLLLRGIGTRHAMTWAFALFGLSTPFLYRMLMIRTQGASLLMLIVTLHLMFQKRYRWLILMGFSYVWLYNGFVLILGFALLYAGAQWICERKIVWQPIVYCGIGLALGLVINPYFPQNIVFIWQHLSAKVDIQNSIRVGNEWYAYDTDVLMKNSLGALVALALGMLHPYFSRRSRDTAELTLLLTALLTLYMVFKSRRFIEYYPAFALLYAAAGWGRSDIPLYTWLPDASHLWERLNWQRRLAYQTATKLLVAAGIVLIFGYFVQRTVRNTYQDAQNARDVAVFAGASAWLKTYTPPGAMVFQTDWDDFTRLFYYNTHNTYLVGLDPTYLQRENPTLWDQWVAITRGQVAEPAAVIQTVFGADYVVSDRQHRAFEERANNDPAMRLVYRDEYSLVWRILPIARG